MDGATWYIMHRSARECRTNHVRAAAFITWLTLKSATSFHRLLILWMLAGWLVWSSSVWLRLRIHFYHCCGKTHISHYTKSLPVVVGSSFNQLCAVHVWLGLVLLFRRGFMCFKKTQMKRGKLFARVQISLNPIPNWSVLIQRPTDDGDGGVDGKHVSESIAIEWSTLRPEIETKCWQRENSNLCGCRDKSFSILV